jgi:hypothetical protein
VKEYTATETNQVANEQRKRGCSSAIFIIENAILIVIVIFCSLSSMFLYFALRHCTPSSVPNMVADAQPTITATTAGASEQSTTTTKEYTIAQPLSVAQQHYEQEMERVCVEGTRQITTPPPSTSDNALYQATCVLRFRYGGDQEHVFMVTLMPLTPLQTRIIQEDVFSTKC